jgi:hypothetical protein
VIDRLPHFFDIQDQCRLYQSVSNRKSGKLHLIAETKRSTFVTLCNRDYLSLDAFEHRSKAIDTCQRCLNVLNNFHEHEAEEQLEFEMCRVSNTAHLSHR